MNIPTLGPRRRRRDEDTRHLVLTPVLAPARAGVPAGPGGGKVVARLAWPLRGGPQEGPPDAPYEYDDPIALPAVIALAARQRAALTLWCPRGWEDLIGSGLAELIDTGVVRWRWVCLDGALVLMRGRVGSHRLSLTCLSAWTGGQWDAWREQCGHLGPAADLWASLGVSAAVAAAAIPDVACAVGAVRLILDGYHCLALGPPGLSVGRAARQWWREWGSPRIRCWDSRPVPSASGIRPRPRYLTVPGLLRPRRVQLVESHCARGLVREQYYRGRVGGPVAVWDVRAAYLLGLCASPLPATYHRSLGPCGPAELEPRLRNHCGLALVRVDTPDTPYPVGRHDGAARAVGSYWAWLAGVELEAALVRGQVREVRQAHLWWSLGSTGAHSRLLLGVASSLESTGHAHVLPLWRSVYSSLVGGWAQRSWKWVTDPRESQIGRWGTWTMLGREGEPPDRWRVVAGRVQRREYAGLARHACPVAYACVTAAVRLTVDLLRSCLPAGSVLATVCDSLWLTAEGAEAAADSIGRAQDSPWEWAEKDTYDDLYMDGRGSAVAVKGDHYYPLLPGVPAGVALTAEGRAEWDLPSPWTDGPGGEGGLPPRRRRAKWDGSGLVARCGHALEPVDPWLHLSEGECPPELEQPYDPRRARRPRGT